jgi:N-acetylmuramoyl-L-alanine amidase
MQKISSNNFNKRPKNAVIDTIIIHYTFIDFKQTVRAFGNDKAKVSSHYVIDKNGKIYSCIEDKDRAWHAGVSYWAGKENINDNSIGIELVNNGQEIYPLTQLDSLIELCKDLQQKYPTIKQRNILGHSDIAVGRKIDPGELFEWKYLADHEIGMFPKDIFIEKNHKIATIGDKNNIVKDIQQQLSNFGYKVNIDGDYGPKTAAIVTSFKTHYCPKYINFIWDAYADSAIKQMQEVSGFRDEELALWQDLSTFDIL